MITIIDYGMGNLGSIANMLKKVGAQAVVTNDVEAIRRADKLILPGVGAFDNGIRNLDRLGLLPVLNEKVLRDKTPVLGICLGMQLLTMGSEEGNLPGLGWINAETVRFRFESDDHDLKVPHMGWNTVASMRMSPLFAGMPDDSRFYFVHSYYIRCRSKEDVLLRTTYGYEFDSAVGRDNIMGTQFHPEKSHKFGMNVMRNFAAL